MMDYKIEITDGLPEMTFVQSEDIMNNIYLSLNIQKGSWWFDPSFGCRLHTIKKLTDGNIALAKDYIKEALQWFSDVGRATNLDIITERDTLNKNRLNISIEVTQTNGEQVSYETFVEVV